MRLVELTVPVEYTETVQDVLDAESVAYTVTGPIEGPEGADVANVSFPAPVNAVEPILDQLWGHGIEGPDTTVVISRTETILSERAEALQSRYASSTEAGTRIARQELVARASEHVPGMQSFLVLLIISVMIAVAGLVANSVAVVVGSMVVAPLMGPPLAASVGTVVADRALFRRGIGLQIIGVLVAVVVASGFAALIRELHFLPTDQILGITEIATRTSPDLLALVVAIVAGAAGAYSLATDSSTTLVGVAVAAALVPPLAVVGIGIAWGRPLVAVGAFVLVIVNLLAINLVAVSVFSWQGYRPLRTVDHAGVRLAVRRRLAVFAVCLLVLSAFLGVVTVGEFQAASTEEHVRGEVTDVLEATAYADVDLVEVRYIDDGTLPVAQPERVIITVGHPPGETYPDLVYDLREAVDESIVIDLNFEEQL